jgi:hypothetical protein
MDHFKAGSPYAGNIKTTPGLVSYWRLDEASAPFKDTIGTNNLVIGNGTTTNVSGAIVGDANGARSFTSASNEYLDKFNPTGLPTGSSAWTMEAWVKLTTSQTDGNVIAWGNVVDNQAMGMQINGQALILNDYSSAAPSFGGSLNDNNWHYIAISYPGSGTTFYGYIDGKPAPTPTVTARTPNMGSNLLEIGGWNGYFNGGIDEPAIYNVALTPAQVWQHYYLGVSQGISTGVQGTRLQGLRLN